MKITIPLGPHGFIVRRVISFDLGAGKITNIEGVLVDAPGFINPKLKEVHLGNGFIRVVTSLKTVTIPIPEKVRFYMKLWFNRLVQATAVATALVAQYGPLLPDNKYVKGVVVGIAALAAAVAEIAHHFNTDGTAQTTAYVPPAK